MVFILSFYCLFTECFCATCRPQNSTVPFNSKILLNYLLISVILVLGDFMEIEVRLFASFRVGRFKCKRLTIGVGTKIIDILNSLEIKKEELGLVLVNGLYSDITLDLNDNDVLAVFPPVAGG